MSMQFRCDGCGEPLGDAGQFPGFLSINISYRSMIGRPEPAWHNKLAQEFDFCSYTCIQTWADRERKSMGAVSDRG